MSLMPPFFSFRLLHERWVAPICGFLLLPQLKWRNQSWRLGLAESKSGPSCGATLGQENQTSLQHEYDFKQ